jgi:hypothetical protein
MGKVLGPRLGLQVSVKTADNRPLNDGIAVIDPGSRRGVPPRRGGSGMYVGDFEINLILGIPLLAVLILWGLVELLSGIEARGHR